MNASPQRVVRWVLLDGIGHVVASIFQGWNHTLCRITTPNGEVTTDRPRRACRKCARALDELAQGERVP